MIKSLQIHLDSSANKKSYFRFPLSKAPRRLGKQQNCQNVAKKMLKVLHSASELINDSVGGFMMINCVTSRNKFNYDLRKPLLLLPFQPSTARRIHFASEAVAKRVK